MGSELKQLSEDLRTQHEHIKNLLTELKTSDHVHLVTNLEELNAVLADHFRLEQRKGGFYDLVGARSEASLKEVDGFERDHTLIKSAFRGLLARARLSAETNEQVLRDEITEVANCLGAHERRESELIATLTAK